MLNITIIRKCRDLHVEKLSGRSLHGIQGGMRWKSSLVCKVIPMYHRFVQPYEWNPLPITHTHSMNWGEVSPCDADRGLGQKAGMAGLRTQEKRNNNKNMGIALR